MDFMDDALFSEALDDFELTAFPFVPSCYISSGFCPTGPTFSTTPTLAPTCSSSLVSSSASGSTAPAPLLASSTRYAPPKTEREIQDAIQSTVPQKTRDDTKQRRVCTNLVQTNSKSWRGLVIVVSRECVHTKEPQSSRGKLSLTS